MHFIWSISVLCYHFARGTNMIIGKCDAKKIILYGNGRLYSGGCILAPEEEEVKDFRLFFNELMRRLSSDYNFDKFEKDLQNLREILDSDLDAAFDGDPAATSKEEIIAAYPGFYATLVHRIAHIFYENGMGILARLMSEVAHSSTGIDIHPGAQIGSHFFIDHGTGIVIGETAVIGNDVRIYQGVTLGAKSLENADALRHVKRHPTIKDHVIIYSGASILGGDTVIGNNVTIGSNVFITFSIPDNKIVRFESKNYSIIDKK